MKRLLKKDRPIHPIVIELRRIRREKKWSVEMLARRTGYNSHSIAKWENGFRHPTVWSLAEWAKALDYNLTIAPGSRIILKEVIPFPDRARLMAGR